MIDASNPITLLWELLKAPEDAMDDPGELAVTPKLTDIMTT